MYMFPVLKSANCKYLFSPLIDFADLRTCDAERPRLIMRVCDWLDLLGLFNLHVIVPALFRLKLEHTVLGEYDNRGID
jgi:hypothetical protein